MRLSQVCRIKVLYYGLGVLMVIGFTLQILGIYFPKRTCQPKQHLMFLKTHKTAGSTILNLLQRYGERNGLVFALPYEYEFNYPYSFQSHDVKGYNASSPPHYDIMCHHMRFNYSEVRKVMPPDTFYFTILRDPANVAESSFSYYRYWTMAFKKAPNLKAFISHPSRYYKPGDINNNHALNPVWFDLGFDSDAPFTETYAKSGIRAVENIFNLVLLAEYFDESMILLKEELCWDLNNVVTFKLNSRETSKTLDREDIEKLREWNKLDWNLYSYFNHTFWDKVERFGRARMDYEVKKLKEIRQQLAKLCLEGSGPVMAEQIKEKALKPYQPETEKILGWVVREDLLHEVRISCTRMVTPEHQYKDLLDTHQFSLGASNDSVVAPTPVGIIGRV